MPTRAGKPMKGDTVGNDKGVEAEVLHRYPGQIAYSVRVRYTKHPHPNKVGQVAILTEFDWLLRYGWWVK